MSQPMDRPTPVPEPATPPASENSTGSAKPAEIDESEEPTLTGEEPLSLAREADQDASRVAPQGASPEVDLSEEPTLVLSAQTVALKLHEPAATPESPEEHPPRPTTTQQKGFSFPTAAELPEHWYRVQDHVRHAWVLSFQIWGQTQGRSREKLDRLWVLLAPWLGRTRGWISKKSFEAKRTLGPMARRALERGKPLVGKAWQGTRRAVHRARHKYPLVGLLISVIALFLGFHLVAYSESIGLLEGTPYYAGSGLGLLAWGLFFWWGSNFHSEDFHVGGDVGICMVPLLVASPLLFTGMLAVANVWFDVSPEEEHITTLVEPLSRLRMEGDEENILGSIGLESWRNAEEQLFLEVPAKPFRLLTLGSPIRVKTHRGALGMEYFVEIQPVSTGP